MYIIIHQHCCGQFGVVNNNSKQNAQPARQKAIAALFVLRKGQMRILPHSPIWPRPPPRNNRRRFPHPFLFSFTLLRAPPLLNNHRLWGDTKKMEGSGANLCWTTTNCGEKPPFSADLLLLMIFKMALEIAKKKNRKKLGICDWRWCWAETVLWAFHSLLAKLDEWPLPEDGFCCCCRCVLIVVIRPPSNPLVRSDLLLPAAVWDFVSTKWVMWSDRCSLAAAIAFWTASQVKTDWLGWMWCCCSVWKKSTRMDGWIGANQQMNEWKRRRRTTIANDGHGRRRRRDGCVMAVSGRKIANHCWPGGLPSSIPPFLFILNSRGGATAMAKGNGRRNGETASKVKWMKVTAAPPNRPTNSIMFCWPLGFVCVVHHHSSRPSVHPLLLPRFAFPLNFSSQPLNHSGSLVVAHRPPRPRIIVFTGFLLFSAQSALERKPKHLSPLAGAANVRSTTTTAAATARPNQPSHSV